MNWYISTEPAREPLTIQEAKQHLRVTHDDEDSYILSLIKMARRYCEQVQGRAYLTQTQVLQLDEFPILSDVPIELPNPPLISITSIAYVDSAGDTQTWSSSYYTVDIRHEPGRVYPGYTYTYPSVRDQRNAVTITYTAGYGTNPASVPQEYRHAMLLMLAHWYEYRQPVLSTGTIQKVPDAAKSLLNIGRVQFI